MDTGCLIFMSSVRFNMSNCKGITGHRSGWTFAVSALLPLHSKGGILLDDFIERSHSWDLEKNISQKIIPHQEPWVGFIHNPQNAPEWFDKYNSPQEVLNRDETRKSLENCKALICLSKYHETWLRDYLSEYNIHIFSIKHPSEIPHKKWSFYRYLANRDKKVVQIGFWLRKLNAIRFLKTNREKVWLPGQEYAKIIMDVEAKLTIGNWYTNPSDTYDQEHEVIISDHLSNSEYDDLLSENIGFLELYDSSANNAVIECIARNTPLLVNKLPAVVEYLGEDYPLYFNDLSEAANKLHSDRLILSAHKYLCQLDKGFLRKSTFRNGVVRNLMGKK